MHSIMLERKQKISTFDWHVKWIHLNRSDWMEVQTETYRAAMNGTLERHFSDMIAVIPTRITIEQLKQRLENITTKVDELKLFIVMRQALLLSYIWMKQSYRMNCILMRRMTQKNIKCTIDKILQL